MKDFDLTTLRLFVAVCEAKSIKRVADREQLDASAITRRLAKLEDQLQMPLIKRVRRGVQATPEGAILFEQAKKLVSDAQKIAIHLTQSKSALTGTLTLAASSANVASVLTEDLASFLLLPDHAKVQIVVKEMMSKDVVQAVRDGEASVGVIWDNTETSGLQHVDYWNDQIAVVMNHSHPLSDREQLHQVDIAHLDRVIMRNTLHTEAVLTRAGVITDAHRAFRLLVPTWEAGLRAAAQGVGVFICSAKLARFWAEPLKLHVKPLADEWNHQINKIIYPTGHVNSLAMRLVAHLSHQQRPANTTSIRPTSPMLEV
jgi:DNA-binding transcriptional LysR family regulator